MGFISLSDLASQTGKGRQKSLVTATQVKRASGAVEIGFRLSIKAMNAIGVQVGDRVDVLHDPESSLWMIKKIDNDGFAVAGTKNKQGGYSSGAVRFTVREGFPKLSEADDEQIKRSSVDDEVVMKDDSIVFRLSE